ncbi:MAG: vitamin K epoxide reductase family protein [Candidatus Baltobacteraceae bacterium]
MGVRAVITLLCGVGLYTSLFMLSKTRRADRGELDEPSVVQTPRARLYAGLSNALVGTLYYVALGLSVWWARGTWLLLALTAAALFAAATSAALAYSLLFVTRRPCPYCWTAHAVNWALLLLVGWLFLSSILSSGI